MKKTLLLVTFLSLFIGNIFSQSVYVTKTGEKYHKKGCRYLQYSSRSLDLKDAIKVGYEPCKVCKPQTNKSSNSTSKQNILQQNYTTKKSTSNTRAVQCSGTTKKGVRCKRMTTNSSGRCYQH